NQGGQLVEPASTEQANEWLTKELDEEAKPMQLLRPSPNHDRLEVVQSTLDVLERIQQPVAFVAVVGPYHGTETSLLTNFYISHFRCQSPLPGSPYT
ncbi:unnamed protein product, partial [Closterium sp. NIES-54]